MQVTLKDDAEATVEVVALDKDVDWPHEVGNDVGILDEVDGNADWPEVGNNTGITIPDEAVVTGLKDKLILTLYIKLEVLQENHEKRIKNYWLGCFCEKYSEEDNLATISKEKHFFAQNLKHIFRHKLKRLHFGSHILN